MVYGIGVSVSAFDQYDTNHTQIRHTVSTAMERVSGAEAGSLLI